MARPRSQGRGLPVQAVLVDSGWFIKAEKKPGAARAHLQALTQFGQVITAIPDVIVEALGRSAKYQAVRYLLNCAHQVPVTPDDGLRAAELLRLARRSSPRTQEGRALAQISVTDALLASVAERSGGIVYSDDPDLVVLQQAGAVITVRVIPF